MFWLLKTAKENSSNKGYKKLKKHKLNINSSIIKLQTFSFKSIQEKTFENCFYLILTVVYLTQRSNWLRFQNIRFLRTSFHYANLSKSGANFNCLSYWLFSPVLCWVRSLKNISWILSCIIWNLKQIAKFKFLVHYFLMLKNGKLC